MHSLEDNALAKNVYIGLSCNYEEAPAFQLELAVVAERMLAPPLHSNHIRIP